jgi:hypothetical protein
MLSRSVVVKVGSYFSKVMLGDLLVE